MKLLQKAVIDKLTFVLFVGVALGSYFTPISTVIFVIASAVIGLVVKSLEGGKK